MFQSSTLSSVQFILIGIGLLFQVMAVSATRRETSLYRGAARTQGEEAPEPKSGPATPSPERIALIERQRSRERDYYEMEKTPPGVSPSELLRTAKVTYIRN